VTTWFTSDTHLGHVNIIQYCGRPYRLPSAAGCKRCSEGTVDKRDDYGDPCCHPDIEAHDQAIVDRWNRRVQPGDVVWHLGDVFLGPAPQAKRLVLRLNGLKHLVLGNHDRHSKAVYHGMGFDLFKRASLTVGHLRIGMAHDPRKLDLTDYDLGLCGHVHEHWVSRLQQDKPVINVGVDVWAFQPVALEELLTRRP
jgi:calcineurin-like phosphoesterase family protein